MKTNFPPDEFSARFVIVFTTIAFFKQMRQGKLISRLLVSAIVSGLVVSYRQGEVTARVSLPNPIIYPAQAPLPSNYPKKQTYPHPSPSSKSPSSNAYSTKDTSNKLFLIIILVLVEVVVVGLIGWQVWKLWQVSRKKNDSSTQSKFSDEGDKARIDSYGTSHSSIPEIQGKPSSSTSSSQHLRQTSTSQRGAINSTGTSHQTINPPRQPSTQVLPNLESIKEKDLVSLSHQPLKILKDKIVIVTTTAELLEIYNHVPKLLDRRIIEVIVNPDSLSSQKPVSLHKQKPGNYWVIKTDTNQDWLLPKRNKKFSIHEYSVLESLFECRGFHGEGSRHFIVKEPAKVSPNPNGEEWKVEAKGVLEFTEISPSANEQAEEQKKQLFSELETAEQTIEQLQEQLQQSGNKSKELQSTLDKSETERQQIRSLLRELQEEVKQQREERQRLFSFLDEKKKEIPQTIKPPGQALHQVLPNLESIQSEEDLVAFYNRNPRALENKIIVVTTTEETEYSFEQQRLGHSAPIIFQKSPTGNYWITLVPQLPSPYYFLVPKANLVVNTPNYTTFQEIFDCEGYQTKTSNKFKLIRPAIVTYEPEGYWKLYALGELEFH